MLRGAGCNWLVSKAAGVAALVVASLSVAADDFDRAVCEANVDPWAREKCLKDMGLAPAEEAPAQATKGSWVKLAEDNLGDATYECKRAIERQAKYDFEWTDGWLGSKISRYLQGGSPSRILYIGDQIKLQNHFGAWQPHIYACEFDTRTKKVVSVAAEPGRLD